MTSLCGICYSVVWKYFKKSTKHLMQQKHLCPIATITLLPLTKLERCISWSWLVYSWWILHRYFFPVLVEQSPWPWGITGDYLCFILGLLPFTSATNLDTLYFLFPSLIYTLPPGPHTRASLGGSFSTIHPLTFFFGCHGSFSAYMLSVIDWKMFHYLWNLALKTRCAPWCRWKQKSVQEHRWCME